MMHHLLHYQATVERYRQALHAIRGAVLLDAALDDPEVRAVVLDEIRAIVDEVLGPPWRAANERESR